MANSKRKHKSLKITQSAKGADCQVRIPNICNFNSETTIFAHLNGGGMGTKHADIFGSFCCSSCHTALDGHGNTEYLREELNLFHYEGIFRTQQILLDKGLIII